MNYIISSPRIWMRALGAAALLLCLDVRPALALPITLGSRIELTPTTFALPIEIVDAVGVSEWFFDLTYDPTDVQINVGCDPFSGDIYCSLLTGPVTEGDFFAAGSPFNLLVPGFIELDPTTLTQSGHLFGMHGAYGGFPPAPSGAGVLAYIEFTLLGTGDSPIDGGGTVVSDPVAVTEPGTLGLLAAALVCVIGRWLFRRGRDRHIVACAALASLAISGTASAQLPTEIIDLPPDLPTAMPVMPSGGYPPTSAPTSAGPYLAPPSWSQTLAGNVRFVILSNFASDAVLDRETGLVWTRRTVSVRAGNLADSACAGLRLGNRMGWRLPAIAELQSLVDLSSSLPPSEPLLPVGHPFLLSADRYWASETRIQGFGPDDRLDRRTVSLTTGSAGAVPIKPLPPNPLNFGVLCVRGAEGQRSMSVQ